ncbi:RING finger domain protein [Purpureocillium lavendulum]|uniref:RING finger domain protein n=1 Tax=Purpureocillium lavendulum TaxID=1247861 RepID=A0AB34FYE0_9HYPO|nr:RING finger domain protein [Purpureocillium lavendulum]
MGETPAPHAPASGRAGPDSAPVPPATHNNVATIAAAVCVSLTLFIVVGLYVLRRRVVRLLESQTGSSPRARKTKPARLAPDDLDTMPLTRYGRRRQCGDLESGKKSEDEVYTCSICTESFVQDSRVRLLCCGHGFHPECVDPWLLERSATCPLW